MSIWRQILSLCGWNFAGLPRRLRGVLVAGTGFFAVVLVFAGVLSVRDGVNRSQTRPDADDIAVVQNYRGALDAPTRSIIEQAPGLLKRHDVPQTAGTVFVPLLIHDWRPDAVGIAAIMAVENGRTAALPNFHLTSGRMMRPGLDEMLIGEGAKRLFPDYAEGRPVKWQQRKWKVVGVYSTGSLVQDSFFLADLAQAQTALDMGSKVSDLYVRLSSPAAFDRFKTALLAQKGLSLKVTRLTDQDQESGKDFNTILTLADGVITLLMAVGAIFAILNVMYASVAARRSEFAVLRAVGFSRLPVVVALLSEAMAIALLGGVLGMAAAGLSFNGLQTSSLIGGHPVAFDFAVTPTAALTALGMALAMGFIGGLFPAIRAARLPIAAALREE